MLSVAGVPIVPQNYALIVNLFLFTALALVFMIMRIYTRAVIVKYLGWDDWLMAGAMVSFCLLDYVFLYSLQIETDPV
jgi:hypothetical protein